MLNRLVGMWSGNRDHATPPPQGAVPPAAEPAARPAAKAPSVMRREAMLGRDQKVAAYTFMLRRAPDEQRDRALPDMQRLYDETLLGNLQRMEIARLLGATSGVCAGGAGQPVDSADDSWPAAGTVWVLKIDSQTPIDDSLLAGWPN